MTASVVDSKSFCNVLISLSAEGVSGEGNYTEQPFPLNRKLPSFAPTSGCSYAHLFVTCVRLHCITDGSPVSTIVLQTQCLSMFFSEHVSYHEKRLLPAFLNFTLASPDWSFIIRREFRQYQCESTTLHSPLWISFSLLTAVLRWSCPWHTQG